MSDLKNLADQLIRAINHASASGMRMNVSIDISPDRDYSTLIKTGDGYVGGWVHGEPVEELRPRATDLGAEHAARPVDESNLDSIAKFMGEQVVELPCGHTAKIIANSYNYRERRWSYLVEQTFPAATSCSWYWESELTTPTADAAR